MMRRPMVFIAALASSAAVLCALEVEIWMVCAAAIAAALVFAPVFRRKLYVPAIAAVLTLAVAVGFGAMERTAQGLAKQYDGTETEVSGIVYRPPVIYEGREVSVIKTELGLIELTRYGNREAHPEVGDRVRLVAELSSPSLPKNLYGINNRTYLYSRKIFLTAVDKGEMEIMKTGGFSPWIIAGRIQSAALEIGSRYLRGDALGLYGAVVFGDRRYMSSELRQNLNAAGLSHVAAVSGMHLSIVAAILMFLLSRLLGKSRIGCAAAILGIIAFAIVTGGSASVTRACIMSVLYLSAKLIYREADGLTSLSAAVVIMLLFNPMVIYSTAFQLSVLATLGILLFMPLWQSKINRLSQPAKYAAGIVLVSLAAQLGAFPVIIYQFNSFPTYFIISNLLIVPMLGFAMLVGLLLPVIGSIPAVGIFWSRLCALAFGYIAFVAGKIAALPHAVIPMGRPDIFVTAAYVAAVAALYFLCAKRRRAAALFTAAALIFALVGGLRLAENDRKATLSFLNVGRGDCAVFCLPGGRTVMVDGGTDSYDADDFLLGTGRGKIDAAVVTSDKREHFGGIAALAEKGMISVLYIPAALAESDAVRVLMAVTDVKIEFYDENTAVFIAGLRLRQTAYNDGAAILAEYGGARIFFCSDGYADWPDCDIVKTPNHGSGKYNYINEINRSGPDYAVISGRASAADGCAYLAPLLDAGVDVHITGESGAAVFELGNIGY